MTCVACKSTSMLLPFNTKIPMNMTHNDAEPITFDSQLVMLVVASNTHLLKLETFHQQHFRTITLLLT